MRMSPLGPPSLLGRSPRPGRRRFRPVSGRRRCSVGAGPVHAGVRVPACCRFVEQRTAGLAPSVGSSWPSDTQRQLHTKAISCSQDAASALQQPRACQLATRLLCHASEHGVDDRSAPPLQRADGGKIMKNARLVEPARAGPPHRLERSPLRERLLASGMRATDCTSTRRLGRGRDPWATGNFRREPAADLRAKGACAIRQRPTDAPVAVGMARQQERAPEARGCGDGLDSRLSDCAARARRDGLRVRCVEPRRERRRRGAKLAVAGARHQQLQTRCARAKRRNAAAFHCGASAGSKLGLLACRALLMRATMALIPATRQSHKSARPCWYVRIAAVISHQLVVSKRLRHLRDKASSHLHVAGHLRRVALTSASSPTGRRSAAIVAWVRLHAIQPTPACAGGQESGAWWWY